ncbi:Chitinase-like protein 1 [Hordeum vulgare]|nr:Chitinase-like protein 1 [Hordeum vulgare]
MGMVRAASFLLLVALLAAADARRQKGGETACDKGWECSGSRFCCNETITDYFKAYQFEELFAQRNNSLAHAAGFWNYQAFITAASLFEPRGFGTTGGREMSMKEVAAFLGHVGAKTSCGYSLATGGSLAWGLCYNHEMSPSQSYCDDSNELYRCAEGVGYYGRGALPVYWNYNYGIVGKGIKQDLLNHPELLEQNATLAFEAAIWRWMTPMKRKQPSAHDAFVGNWKPTKKDTLSKRYPGFGVTMNILYGDAICGKGHQQPLLTFKQGKQEGDGAHQHPPSCLLLQLLLLQLQSLRLQAVITAFAAGSRCSADPACPEPIEQHNVNSLSGPANTQCYRRRDFAAVALLPFLLPHVDMASAADSYDGSIIRDGVRNVLSKVKAAGVLRLVFHDAGTFDISDKSGGMNGSIIYEADRPENTGLSKSLKILRKAKEGIDQVQQVSWADLIAVAGAEAVALCGGPEIPVRLGRLDSSTADPTGKLPEETLDVVALKTSFGKKGFSTQEMVVLSGAHTIGGKGFGNPNAFDNAYFKVLLEKPRPTSSGMPIGLPTDWALTEDDECLRYSTEPDSLFNKTYPS